VLGSTPWSLPPPELDENDTPEKAPARSSSIANTAFSPGSTNLCALHDCHKSQRMQALQAGESVLAAVVLCNAVLGGLALRVVDLQAIEDTSSDCDIIVTTVPPRLLRRGCRQSTSYRGANPILRPKD